jgi:hypothetical protein
MTKKQSITLKIICGLSVIISVSSFLIGFHNNKSENSEYNIELMRLYEYGWQRGYRAAQIDAKDIEMLSDSSLILNWDEFESMKTSDSIEVWNMIESQN